MELYQEEDEQNGKIYNKNVLRLLFRYIFAYRKYLIIALVFVLFITGSNLAVPFLFKTIIDRFIFKQGRIVDIDNWQLGEQDAISLKRIRHAVRLTDSLVFLYQSDLKYYSKKEIDEFITTGVFSPDLYMIIDSSIVDPALSDRIGVMQQEGDVIVFSGSRYLFKTSILDLFTVSELTRLRRNDFVHIIQYILLIIAILLVQFGSSYLQIIILMRISQNAMKDLRRDLFFHVLNLEISYYDRNAIGRLVNRVTNDIERLNELFSSVLVTLFQDILMMLGIIAVMFFSNLTLALIVAASFPFLALLTILFRIRVRNAYRVIRTKIGELNSFLNETITGIRIVQIFVREVSNFKKFMNKNGEVYDAQLRQLYVNAVFRPLIGFMQWFAIAAVIYFGAQGIVQSRLSFGLLVMFIAYIERFFHPVRDLSEKFDIMQSATAAGEKIISIFNADALHEGEESRKLENDGSSHTRPGARRVTTDQYKPTRMAGNPGDSFLKSRESRFKGHIEFDDVWFSYKPGEWVLRGVSLNVKPRETLAIVGETGAGKSTIINLLSKFYRVQKGRILIDGKNIDDIPYSQVRSNIVSVMQDVFLFSSNVRKNIILGKPYDGDLFRKVSEITHVEKFINDLPLREEQPVMERGATFSAGERQLLSFARALYFDPTILVLDEATSSIDTETEKLIQDAIISLTKGRTSIVIAHRLSTIRNAGKIIVIDRGRIVEEGRHRDLLAKKGIYHQLYTLQFGSLK